MKPKEKDALITQLLEARGKIDAKLGELGRPADGGLEQIRLQLTAIQTSVNALANRAINITVPERQVTINNQAADPGDLEVQGPGGSKKPPSACPVPAQALAGSLKSR